MPPLNGRFTYLSQFSSDNKRMRKKITKHDKKTIKWGLIFLSITLYNKRCEDSIILFLDTANIDIFDSFLKDRAIYKSHNNYHKRFSFI